MNLREGFQYMNFINERISDLEILLYGQNLLTIKEEHYKSTGNKEAVDEEIMLPPAMDYKPMELVKLFSELIKEKTSLSMALQKGKNQEENLDHLISTNSANQKYAKTLKNMIDQKPKESLGSGCAYMINNEGNQVKYYYDVKSIINLNYDKDTIKAIYKEINEQCRNTSTLIDKIQINTELDFSPKYDLTDSLDDMLI